jgi:hypothetical protein
VKDQNERVRAVDRANRAWHLAIYQPYQVVGLTSESGLSGWTGAGWGKAGVCGCAHDEHCGASYACVALLISLKPMHHARSVSQSLGSAASSVLYKYAPKLAEGRESYLRCSIASFADAARLIDSSSFFPHGFLSQRFMVSAPIATVDVNVVRRCPWGEVMTTVRYSTCSLL